MKVATAKCIELEGRIKHEENKLNGIQDPTYSDDQKKMIEDRIKILRDELNGKNEEIDIIKGEASKQINQIRGSITKFLDKGTATLGDRIRTLNKEQGITIVSIITVVGMAIRFLIESFSGGPTVSTSMSDNTSSGNKKEVEVELGRKLKKKQIESFTTIINRQSIGSPTRNNRLGTFMDFEHSKRSGWLVISEFVGTYNRCWSFDIHIFYDTYERKINHLNIHHTVKIAVIPNIKASWST